MAAHSASMLPRDIGVRLASLEAFRRDVWGNDVILTEKCIRQSGSNTRTVEYLNFGKYLRAVQYFCKAITDEKLLVVQEYREAMDTFISEDETYEAGACILGQPGIGKSCFIAFAVVERLRERHPVAVQVFWGACNAYILFSDNAVTFHNAGDTLPLEEHPSIWAFSDSDAYTLIPIPDFTESRGVRTFQTTFPAVERWKAWTKYARVDLYFMDLPTDDEIEDFAFIFELDSGCTKSITDRWGPVFRTLQSVIRNPRYQERLIQTVEGVAGVAVMDPLFVIQAIANLNNATDSSLSSIFFIKSQDKKNISRDVHSVYIPTNWLVEQIVDKIMQEESEMRICFFRTLEGHPATRSGADAIFKEYIHRILVSGNRLPVHWYTRPGPTCIFPPLQTLSSIADLGSNPPFCWRPKSPMDKGYDSVIFIGGGAYIIEATISRDHPDPQGTVDDLWKSMPSAKKCLHWKFVFVGLHEHQIATVSKRYAKSLEVGDDEDTTVSGKRKRESRTHLPVGRVAVVSTTGIIV